ncbi:unknown; predicted coding region [Mycoplasmopsis pulmonis]|uniref:Uncharacterized protein n=1 Tax=Mycoplasmopsis pulmonis (strain UAB CTIP) TaxID=272635 RepID=Q98PH8_MYCPU|nr:unknown; predicted coding region [Mycoplasmopsis pulmonis]
MSIWPRLSVFPKSVHDIQKISPTTKAPQIIQTRKNQNLLDIFFIIKNFNTKQQRLKAGF